MLISQMQYFTAVVRTGSFTEAAAECNISQSAVSQQIKALESELGVALLEREKRSFKVTEAGEYFYQKCLAVMSDIELMKRNTVKIGKKDLAVLNLGYLNGYGGSEFRDAVAEFAAKYPKVQINLSTGSHENLYNELTSGKIDLAFNDQRRVFNPSYENMELICSRSYVHISSHNPMSQLPSIDVDDLRNTPCILVAREDQKQNEKDYYHNQVGFDGEFLFAGNLQDARMLVAAGRGVMPVEGTGKTEDFDNSVKIVPLLKKGNQICRKYCAFWNKENSGYYVEEFAEILKRQF